MSPIETVTVAHALRHQPAALAWCEVNTALIRVTGKDAERFLQNRTSNDVAALKAGESHWNTVLDKGARLQGLFQLGRDTVDTNAFWLAMPSDHWPVTEKALFQFRIIEAIEAKPTDWTSITVYGNEAGWLLAEALAPVLKKPFWQLGLVPNQLQTYDETVLWRHDDIALPGYTVWSHDEDILVALRHALVAVPLLSAAERRHLQAEAGLPAFGSDMDATTLLPETGLETRAVSYSKGCYLGQETVARVKTYGSVPKALVALVFPENTLALPPTGDLIAAEENFRCGRMTRGFDSPMLNQPVALAYLDKTHRVPGSVLRFTIDGQTFSATVALLPLVASAHPEKAAAEAALAAGLKAFSADEDGIAIDELQRAIVLDATLLDAYEALGAILGRLNRYDDAIAVTQRLTTLDPDRIMAHTNLSVFYMQVGNKELAEEEKAMATVLTMRAKMASAGFVTSQQAAEEAAAKKRQQLQERVTLFETALAANPDDPLGNFGLGSTLLELGEFARSVEALTKTVGLPTSQSAAYLKLGEAYEGLGDVANACATYEAGLEVASRRRDLQPLSTMQARLSALAAIPTA